MVRRIDKELDKHIRKIMKEVKEVTGHDIGFNEASRLASRITPIKPAVVVVKKKRRRGSRDYFDDMFPF